MRTIFIFILFINLSQAQYQDSFNNLTEIYHNELGKTNAYVLPSYKPIKSNNSTNRETEEFPLAYVQVFPNQNNKIALILNTGPTDDYSYKLINLYTGDLLLDVRADEIYINGTGNIYTIGGNSRLNIKRKYIFDGHKFNEVKQTFYYIGKNTLLRRGIKIYADKRLKIKLAFLPRAYEIRILGLTFDKDNFPDKVLIITKFGLVGWQNFDPHDYQAYYQIYQAD